jgi:DNA repair protein RecO
MRHKYETRGIVLSRSSVGEASTFVTLITQDMGLVRALTQGVRKSGSRLAHALTTFAESDVVLIRGKNGWRLAGAVLAEDWFKRLGSAEPRERAGRICSLLLRLSADETNDRKLFLIINGFFSAISSLPSDLQEAAEILTALRILSTLGFDDKGLSEGPSDFTRLILTKVLKNRSGYISRINHGIDMSGL